MQTRTFIAILLWVSAVFVHANSFTYVRGLDNDQPLHLLGGKDEIIRLLVLSNGESNSALRPVMVIAASGGSLAAPGPEQETFEREAKPVNKLTCTLTAPEVQAACDGVVTFSSTAADATELIGGALRIRVHPDKEWQELLTKVRDQQIISYRVAPDKLKFLQGLNVVDGRWDGRSAPATGTLVLTESELSESERQKLSAASFIKFDQPSNLIKVSTESNGQLQASAPSSILERLSNNFHSHYVFMEALNLILPTPQP